jgi:hypothetical protein
MNKSRSRFLENVTVEGDRLVFVPRKREPNCCAPPNVSQTWDLHPYDDCFYTNMGEKSEYLCPHGVAWKVISPISGHNLWKRRGRFGTWLTKLRFAL